MDNRRNAWTTDSKRIEARFLENQYARVKGQLAEGELLMAVSRRKPLRLSGAFCVFIGGVFAEQIVRHYLLASPLWSIPAVLFSLALLWVGFRLAFLVGREYVFVTDRRLAHQTVDLLGRFTAELSSIPIAEIDSLHLYKGTVMYRPMTNTIGDILVRKKNGKTYLVPTLLDGVCISEAVVSAQHA